MTCRTLKLVTMLLTLWTTALAFSIGATVQNTSVDTQTQTATIRILNTSSKDISGYTIAYDTVYANGSTDHGEYTDDYPATRSNQSKLLRPGETRDITINGDKTGNSLVKIDAKVIVVIYADETADVENEEAFDKLLAVRKGHELAQKEAARILEKALADTSSADPRAAAIAQLKQSLYRLQNEDYLSVPGKSAAFNSQLKGVIKNELHFAVQALQAPAAGQLNDRDDLKQYLDERLKQASVAAQHAQIRRAQ